jgi:hypothetical protein
MTRVQIITCVALIAVLVAVAVVQRRPHQEADSGPQMIVAEGTLTAETVARIELSRDGRDGEAGSLQRTSEGWIMTSRDGAPVDTDRVLRLLDALDGLVGEERAADPALLPEFELDGDGVIHVVCSADDGQQLVHLLVGKRGPGVNQSFVRLDGDDRAWLGHAGIHAALGIHGQGDRPLDPDHFIQMRLLTVEGADVIGMQVDGDLGVWSVEGSADGGWAWSGGHKGEPPQQRAATGRAHTFARLRADGLVGRMDPAATGLDEPAGRAMVRTAEGEQAVLIGDPIPEDPDAERPREERYVAVQGEGLVWRLRAAAVESLFRDLQ